MRRIAILVTLLLGLGMTSCAAGPHQLRRSVDDWDAKIYTQKPWLDALLWLGPLPIMTVLAGVGDAFIGDAYTFWVQDVWENKGTGFKHKEFLGTKGHMKSLLFDDGKFLEVTMGEGS